MKVKHCIEAKNQLMSGIKVIDLLTIFFKKASELFYNWIT